MDEEIIAQLSRIANNGTRRRETQLSRGGPHSVSLDIMKSLPTIRKILFPLQYSVKMIPTIHSKKYSSNGSFLTTAQALHTMDSLMHNFKGGLNLVKDGEPEYNTLRQDSVLQKNVTAALRKLPITPYMQSVNLEKESIASFVLQNWSPHICNIIEKTTGQSQDPPSSPLSAICRPC